MLDSSPTRKRKIIVDFFTLSLSLSAFCWADKASLLFEEAVGEVRVRAGQDFDSKIPVKLTPFFPLCLYLSPTKSSRVDMLRKIPSCTDVLTGGARSEGVSDVQD